MPRRRRIASDTEIKAAIRLRDGHRCCECGVTDAEHRATTGRGVEVHRNVPGSCYSLLPGACTTLCRACHGPKPRSPYGSSPWRNIWLEKTIIRDIRTLAAFHGVRFKEYLADIMKQAVAEART